MYSDLYKAEKLQYEKALHRYQEDNLDEEEIISLHKRCNKRGVKADTKGSPKVGEKPGAKAPRKEYHLFLREQHGMITKGDRKNYQNIISGRWKKIKEGPARLIIYNIRAK